MWYGFAACKVEEFPLMDTVFFILFDYSLHHVFYQYTEIIIYLPLKPLLGLSKEAGEV